MAIKQVIRMGHPVLRQIAKELTKEEILSEEIKSLIVDMQDTMEAEGGIGIAAPQIAVSLQTAIIELPENSERYGTLDSSAKYIIFNPKITPLTSELQGFWEGCLSVPGLRGFVEREKKVRIEYLDENAVEQVIEPEGFLATVFQHELDHLFGKLYIDRIKDTTLISYNEEFEQFNS
ncbi:MAG: peptide deformylase [Bdellovibrionales bacterium CG12_big_fil_rev_8_21_14_0_65_38_15]|nr:MAG: peptide deformylase [Bdellovibrionales bacterium CG22_combo_CG10-13_8_21_14_all_38_13]PIQ53523.1 MAG: peptide deformylase [Bdellovibrionales bacterium CG12_big_fil_rev_8_21_14_0_65_38_15]PIR28473.1 MAG: peptide deformylase [Bdellovibrionales bacterium CG11_big_fil_rev_8_21_14_0_20_38_13]